MLRVSSMPNFMTHLNDPFLVFAGIVLIVFVVSWILSRSHLPLPPGPRASWFGKLSLPTQYPWITYAQWSDIYGDIIYYNTFGNSILVLNSLEAAADLLVKRGNIYSSRPHRVMVVELIGWDWLFSSMPYGSRWKRHRNLFHKHFKRTDSQLYNSMQVKQTHALLRTLLHDPDNFRAYVRRSSSAVVLGLTYGHQVAEEGDEYVALADKAISSLAQAGIFGTYLVDYLPWLRHVPAWFPFANFKRQAAEWRKPVREMLDRPFNVVKEKMLEGKATPCFVSEELENLVSAGTFEGEDIIKNTAASIFAGGSDTVVSSILSFFLVMTLHPEIQKRAQVEIDRVIGSRLPALTDRRDLPLVESICYELLRWNPVSPLGLARYVSETNEYRGFVIPKGTTVFYNVWAMLHNPERYPDPLTFKGDRFLNRQPGINEIPEVGFGLGRRICPVYDVEKAVDRDGNIIEVKPEYTSLLLSHPEPFKCSIRPRSQQSLSLIEQTMEN